MTQQSSISRLRPVIRVFVSSTFSDLKHERDALQREVFPRLEQFCASWQFQFQAIDLRWGISTEAGDDHRTMRICFDELRRSQEVSPEPNFLILLGNRYGMRPLPEEISQAEYEQLAAAAQFGGEDRAPIPGTHGKTALQVLRDWYRCDENVLLPVPPKTELDRTPLNYVLQPRTQDLHDGRDYTRTNQTNRAHSQAWRDVQQVLRRIIDVAFPVESLDQRFDHIDWPQHVACVNDTGNPSQVIPQIVRFQASATEQEIWHGALSAPNAERHVLAFFRDITNRDDFAPEEARDFFDLTETRGFDEAAAKRQNALRKAITERLGEDATLPVPYSRLKREGGKVVVDASEADTRAFCDAVFERLRPIIERQIEAYWRHTAPASADRAARDLEIEQREYERFAEERGGEESFVGRQVELQAILDYVGSNSRWPLVIHGASGCGKTALLARASQEVAKTRKRVERFIGVAPRSSDLRSLLSSLCQELRQRNPCPGALPTEIQQLRDEFSQHLQAATPEQPLILFLDALDQLADADNGRRLNWLPPGSLPAHVKLVVSCLSDRANADPSGQPCAELQRRQIPAESFIDLDVLSEAEARLLLFDRWLPKAGRKVSDDQRARIEQRLASPACRQPIYLKLLFDEVQLWHSYDPATVPGESVPELLGQLFDRLSQPTNHGPLLVNRVLGYLSASRHGLAENEILEILFADPEYRAKLNEASEQTRHALPPNAKRIPIALWSRLRFDLAPYLTERAAPGANVLTFYHRQVAECVQERYAKSSGQTWQPHQRLVNYFSAQEYFLESLEKQRARVTLLPPTPRPANVRKVDELPWQRVEVASLSGQWDEVGRLFTDLAFLEAKAEAGMVFDLATDFALALEAMPLQRPHYRTLQLLEEALRRDIHFIARHPTTLFQCVWNSCWWYDCPQVADHCRKQGGEIVSENEPLPWEQGGICVYHLLENWFASKSIATPRFRWVRSLRPPAVALACGQVLVLSGHEGPVHGLATAQDGCNCLSADCEGFRFWDLITGRETSRVQFQGGRGVAALPDGQQVEASRRGDVRVWDASSQRETYYIRGGRSSLGELCRANSPDGKLLAVSYIDKNGRKVEVRDAASGASLLTLNLGGFSQANCLAFSPNSLLVATGGQQNEQWATGEGNLRLWDVIRGVELHRFEGHEGMVTAVAFSKDGRHLLSGANDGTVRVWALDTLRRSRLISRPPRSIAEVKFSADGKSVWGTPDMWFPLMWRWNAETGVFLGTKEDGPDEPIYEQRGDAEAWHANAENTEKETRIVSSGGELGAWFPAYPDHWTSHPTEQIWAAAQGNHLFLIRLEGIKRDE